MSSPNIAIASQSEPMPSVEIGNSGGVEEELLSLTKQPDQFLKLFRTVRESQTREAARACMRYLADHEPDQVGQTMRIWLSSGTAYLELLLDPEFLTLQQATQVVRLLRDTNLALASSLQKQLMSGQIALDPERLDRAIQILPAVMDPGVLIPWLRNLAQVGDPHVRSKAAKAICVMRPNLMMIERQLKSEEPRVRANALEALWEVKGVEAVRLFNECLTDSSHRVVVNALIGLQRNGVANAFNKLIALGDHASPVVRRAAIWGMGFLKDKRAVPCLCKLLEDAEEEVRIKARELLEVMAPEALLPKPEPEAVPEELVAVTAAADEMAEPVNVPAAAEPIAEKKGWGWKRKPAGVLNI